eukprot:SAG25_NODE_552_length_6985_cov_2.281295_6_plen_125_part_00
MVGMRSDEDRNAENGVINGVARKLKDSQDEVVSHQDKIFKGVQEQVDAIQTSIEQTQEQAQVQAKAMQTSIDHTNEKVDAMQTAITQTQEQVAQILSLLQAPRGPSPLEPEPEPEPEPDDNDDY